MLLWSAVRPCGPLRILPASRTVVSGSCHMEQEALQAVRAKKEWSILQGQALRHRNSLQTLAAWPGYDEDHHADVSDLGNDLGLDLMRWECFTVLVPVFDCLQARASRSETDGFCRTGTKGRACSIFQSCGALISRHFTHATSRYNRSRQGRQVSCCVASEKALLQEAP